MNIEDMQLKEILPILEFFRNKQPQSSGTIFWKPGRNYFIRTVTHHHTGELVEVTDQEVILCKAAWIADDGRLTDSLKTGEFNEVEMFPIGKVLIGRGSIIDAVEISTIPKNQK